MEANHKCNQLQQEAIDLALNNQNIFITGPAGVGKSFIVKQISEEFYDREIRFALLAFTGVASVNIGGVTIHSFFGLKPTTKTIEEYRKQSWKPKIRWDLLQTLIFDEVSMIHNDLFCLVDQICRYHKKKQTPFGGLQVILVGDFYQLSPIPDTKNITSGQKLFIFENELFSELNLKTIKLSTIMRQKDNTFIDALNCIRIGDITPETTQLLEYLHQNEEIKDKKYIKLFSRNVDKNHANQMELDKLPGKSVKFKSSDSGDLKYLKNLKVENVLELKEGCTVVCLRNYLAEGIYNGSLGSITHFESNGSPVVKFNNGVTKTITCETWEYEKMDLETGRKIKFAQRTQIPLALGYSSTIHSAQGMQYDYVYVDCKGIFCEGQFYIAVSRATNKEGLIIKNFKPKNIIVSQKVNEFYQ